MQLRSAQTRSKEKSATEATQASKRTRNKSGEATSRISSDITSHFIPHNYSFTDSFTIEQADHQVIKAPSTPDPTPEETFDATTPYEIAPEEFLPEKQSLPSYATSSATKFLQKQLRQIIKLQLSTNFGDQRYWTLDLARLDDLYTWYFTLSTFDPDIPLSVDMRKFNVKGIHIQVKFGPQHPYTPPFVRIIKPRFMQWMNGGGGHVTAGGSICIDMLTMKGWKKDITVDHVLMVVHHALSDVDPVPAKLIGTQEYSPGEAVRAYIRVANTHGWRVPQNWNTLFAND
jgi:ubiquitin-protein ligase